MTIPFRWKLAVRSLSDLDGDPPHVADVELAGAGERRMTPQRRREWLAGRALARRLLVKAIGARPCGVALARAPSGAPQARIWLAGAWQPAGWGVSLSHRAGAVAAVVWDEPRLGIGIDLERDELRSPEMIEDFFDPKEQAALSYLNPIEKSARTASLWSLKEAGLKALGVGLAVDPRRLLVEAAGGERWLLRPTGELAGLRPLVGRTIQFSLWMTALAVTFDPPERPLGEGWVAPEARVVGSWLARMGLALRRGLAELSRVREDGE